MLEDAVVFGFIQDILGKDGKIFIGRHSIECSYRGHSSISFTIRFPVVLSVKFSEHEPWTYSAPLLDGGSAPYGMNPCDMEDTGRVWKIRAMNRILDNWAEICQIVKNNEYKIFE